jgi:hypothetical protein
LTAKSRFASEMKTASLADTESAHLLLFGRPMSPAEKASYGERLARRPLAVIVREGPPIPCLRGAEILQAWEAGNAASPRRPAARRRAREGPAAPTLTLGRSKA